MAENYLSAPSVIAGFSDIPRTQWGCPDLGDLNVRNKTNKQPSLMNGSKGCYALESTLHFPNQIVKEKLN
jgi:hypothetical protein